MLLTILVKMFCVAHGNVVFLHYWSYFLLLFGLKKYPNIFTFALLAYHFKSKRTHISFVTETLLTFYFNIFLVITYISVLQQWHLCKVVNQKSTHIGSVSKVLALCVIPLRFAFRCQQSRAGRQSKRPTKGAQNPHKSSKRIVVCLVLGCSSLPSH